MKWKYYERRETQLFRPPKSYHYIYCTPDILTPFDTKLGRTPHITRDEMIQAIQKGNLNRFVYVSQQLQSKKSAIEDGESWSFLTGVAMHHFWLIKIDISEESFIRYRKTFSLVVPLGIFLKPIRDHVIKCINLKNEHESIAEKDLILHNDNKSSCTIL